MDKWTEYSKRFSKTKVFNDEACHVLYEIVSELSSNLNPIVFETNLGKITFEPAACSYPSSRKARELFEESLLDTDDVSKIFL